MSYTIQIEPPLSTIKTTETKRQSLYTCIRYASKLINLRTEYHKHRTLPNDMIPSTKYDTHHNSYCYDNSKEEQEEEVETLYDEKVSITTITKPSYYSSRRDSQLALPSRLKYVSSPAARIIHQQQIDNNEDEKEYQDFDDCSSFDDDEDSIDELDNYIIDESYNSALQKLSGISFKQNKPNTAVLITLSPCALAAANAARQRRQKIRVSH